ncbi:MAG: RNA polymerase subunit sigma-70 [Anaerolineae bacterium]|nr:RNA polymerase subunit sigma-70 [Gloeobacterales cyanobacterium ES-bin-313]
MVNVAHTVEFVARTSYGRLVAYLAVRAHDLGAAEDALSEAFRIALETWPRDGVPYKPEAWLLAVARRRMIDDVRHAKVKADAVPTLKLLAEEAQEISLAGTFPDERLKLLFICAHPAIAERARTPLMLQTVLGLDATRIASAFLVAPATMSQRLVRAKAKIRDARIAFEVPSRNELPMRLSSVMEAVYAAYGTGWEDVTGTDPRRQGLADEAIWLARVLVQLLPEEPEVRGLLALMMHCEARRGARRAANGDYIPLADQNVALWSKPMIDEAERELAQAATYKSLGCYQLEAAIQSVHAQRLVSGTTNWPAIALLYEYLVALAPTLGALVGRAAALAQSQDPSYGLSALDAISADLVVSYQPYWAVRAHLLAKLGKLRDAEMAYTRAIGLSEDAQVRAFLIRQSQRITDGSGSTI